MSNVNTRKLVRHANAALFDDLEARNPALAARLYELAANYTSEKFEGLSNDVFGEVLSNAKENILYAYHCGVKRAGKGDNMPESLLDHPALAYAYMIGQ